MQLIELRLSNFRRFEDLSLRFSPGLTLIWGPNESGKSTIHQAISCALFGRERRLNAERWDGGKCSVCLTYRSGGRVYRIERRLSEGVSSLGVVNGEELSDVVTQRDEIESLLAEHLGISSRQVFENTVSVGQSDLSRPAASDLEVVGSEIQRILTGTARFSAAEVLRRLEARRNDVKGRPRSANPREYDRISDRLASLADELAKARASRKRISDLEEELSQLQDTVSRNSERLESLRELLERHRRWSELKAREEDLERTHGSVFSTSRKIKETMADLKSAQKEMEKYTDLVGRDDEIADHLAKIEARRGELQSRLTDLATGGEREPAVAGFAPLAVNLVAALLAIAGIALGFLKNPYFALMALPAVLFGLRAVLTRGKDRSHEMSRLADMEESCRRDLKQLDVEEQSILSVIGCAEVEEARAKIESYRNLAQTTRELEVKYKTLLDGRKAAEWEAQEEELARELSLLRKELKDEFTGYAPSTKEAEGWRSEFAKLQSSLVPAQARLEQVSGALEAERRNARDLAALEGEIEYLHARKDELDFTYKAYGEAIASLEQITQSVSEEYLPVLSERASEHLRRITSGRYNRICMSPDWHISLECRERTGVDPGELSVGALDQLYLALRIACGELLSGQRELPVILDDPFAAFDRRRLENALGMLRVMAADTQILLMTHDPHILEWARDMESSKAGRSAVHELPAPSPAATAPSAE